jgi:hypothetical protein
VCVDFVEGIARVHGSAFPSAHVAGAIVVLLCVRRFLPRATGFALPLIVLMCAATVYLRYHYFSDVLGGTVVGFAAFYVTKRWTKRRSKTNEDRAGEMLKASAFGRGSQPIVLSSLVLVIATYANAQTPELLAASTSSHISANHTAPSADLANIDRFEQAIQSGTAAMYDGRLDEAGVEFRRLRRTRPDHPAAEVYGELIAWWRAVADPGDDGLAKDFERDADKAIASSRAWVKAHSEDADGWLYLASAYGAVGRFHATVRKSAWGAIHNGMAAHDAVLRARQLDASLADEGLGLGAYDYFAATVPPLIRPFAWLFGVRGDRERGLRELQQTAEKGRHARVEAQLVLASAWWSEQNYPQFEQTLESITTAYPHNLIIKNWQVSGWVRLKNWQRASETIDSAAAFASPAWINFERGRVSLARHEWSAAEREFTAAIDGRSANVSLTAWAYEGRARARRALDERGAENDDHGRAHELAPAAMAFADELLHVS